MWTSLPELTRKHGVATNEVSSGLYELQMMPSFAIGQRALLVTTPQGNVLWDCIALLNDPTIAFIKSKGGLRAIAFSHPHYYTTMNEWAEVFNCPILIHQQDEPWIFNRGPHVRLWSGAEEPLWEGMKLLHVGGHFPGSSVLQVPFLSAAGAILCGDTFYISPSKKHIAVMYSYPNMIPLPLCEIARIKQLMQPIPFDTMYGFYSSQNVLGEAKTLLDISLAGYRA